jgi:fluoroquinolone transport system permease protein
MSGSLLLRLMLWDVRVQARERIYLFTVITTGIFMTAIALLPDDTPAGIVAAILFLDPAVIGMGFVGGLVLLERSQGTPPALAVTPVAPTDYAISKLVTFTALTITGGLAILAVATWPPSPALLLRASLALAFTGTLSVLGGLVMVATANSLNNLIARAFPVSIVLYLPFLAHFGMVKGWLAWVLFGINPGHAMLRALLWAVEPTSVSFVETIYAFGYMTVLGVALFAWAVALYARTINHTGN